MTIQIDFDRRTGEAMPTRWTAVLGPNEIAMFINDTLDHIVPWKPPRGSYRFVDVTKTLGGARFKLRYMWHGDKGIWLATAPTIRLVPHKGAAWVFINGSPAVETDLPVSALDDPKVYTIPVKLTINYERTTNAP